MLAVPGLASGGDTGTVPNGERELRRSIHFKSLRKLRRGHALLIEDEPRSFLESLGILVELEHIPRLQLRCVSLLSRRQMRRNPGWHRPLRSKFALCGKPIANRCRGLLRF